MDAWVGQRERERVKRISGENGSYKRLILFLVLLDDLTKYNYHRAMMEAG